MKVGVRKNQEALCKFYLIRPQHGTCTSHAVKRLISMNGVEEVHVTEGDYGFIVRAKPAASKPIAVQNSPQKMKWKVSEVVSYARYKK